MNRLYEPNYIFVVHNENEREIESIAFKRLGRPGTDKIEIWKIFCSCNFSGPFTSHFTSHRDRDNQKSITSFQLSSLEPGTRFLNLLHKKVF